MKIGILTMHSQLNYGAILQCWALQIALTEMGHEVIILDRWEKNAWSALSGAYRNISVKDWCRLAIRLLLKRGALSLELRHLRTRCFIKRKLSLSKYHFHTWSDAPKELGVECIIVGSDQVFACHDDVKVYFFEGRGAVKAISYAASFGQKSIPVEWIDVYRGGLLRFAAVSCREREGLDICNAFGVAAQYVCDPTLLLSQQQWNHLCGCMTDVEKCCGKPRLLFYCIVEDDAFVDDVITLDAFAEENGCIVEVFTNEYIRWRWQAYCPKLRNVLLRLSAGPGEFISALRLSTWVLTNAFHGLMLSVIFRKNVRVLSPRSEIRAGMFGRISEFAEYIDGRFIVENVEDALNSFGRGEAISINSEKLSVWIEQSREFLRENIRALC